MNSGKPGASPTSGFINFQSSATPFNGSSYSVPPSRPRAHQAIIANEATAAVLGHIDRSLAHRVRHCRPGDYRCRAWRYCAFCGPSRQAHFVRDYRDRLSHLHAPVHLTLTKRSCYLLTREALPTLAAAFALFRGKPRFGHSARGGVVNYQIAHGERGWLPHIHALLDYRDGLSKNWVKKTWTDLGGGYEVKFQTVEPGTQGRVLVYGTRRPDLPLDPDLLSQFYWATKGFRFIQPWGTLHPLHGRRPQRRGQGAQDKCSRAGANPAERKSLEAV